MDETRPLCTGGKGGGGHGRGAGQAGGGAGRRCGAAREPQKKSLSPSSRASCIRTGPPQNSCIRTGPPQNSGVRRAAGRAGDPRYGARSARGGAACPLRTGGGTRLVRLVREGGGGGACLRVAKELEGRGRGGESARREQRARAADRLHAHARPARGTRRVRLVRDEGRGVSSQYGRGGGRGGGGGGDVSRKRGAAASSSARTRARGSARAPGCSRWPCTGVSRQRPRSSSTRSSALAASHLRAEATVSN